MGATRLPDIKLGNVLVVDDEEHLVTTLCEGLKQQGYTTYGTSSGTEAIKILRSTEIDILLTDLMMPEMDGIELIKASLETDQQIIPIIMTGQGTIQTAVEAMKSGAYDYILKPFKLSPLLQIIARAMHVRKLKKENIELRGTLAIYELTKAINLTMDPHTIANKVADAAIEQSKADEVSIMLPTENGEGLYVAAVRGEGREHLLGEKVKIGEGIAGWVAKSGQMIQIEGKPSDLKLNPVNPRKEIKSSVSIPMVAGGKFLGVLNINALKKKSFSVGEIKGLTITVSMAAPTLENAWLFDQVQTAEEKYRHIFNNAAEGIFQVTPDGRLITVNPAFASIFGFRSPDEITKNTTIGDQLCIDSSRYQEFIGSLEQQGKVTDFEAQVKRRDGQTLWVKMSGRAIRDNKGGTTFYEGSVEDVTEKKHLESALLRAAQEWRATFDAIKDMVWLEDNEGKIIRCNMSARDFIGKPFTEIIGRHCFELIHQSDKPIPECPKIRMQKSLKRESSELKMRGTWYQMVAYPILNDDGMLIGTVHTISDITSHIQTQEQLLEMSFRDHLTGMHNRRGFFVLGEQQLKLAQRTNKGAILIYADLDDMKWINDTLGHVEGNQALKDTATIMAHTFRESDIVARIGGDEFAALAIDAPGINANSIIERLQENIDLFNKNTPHPYVVSLSVGTVEYRPDEATTLSKLLNRADSEMYEHKKEKQTRNE